MTTPSSNINIPNNASPSADSRGASTNTTTPPSPSSSPATRRTRSVTTTQQTAAPPTPTTGFTAPSSLGIRLDRIARAQQDDIERLLPLAATNKDLLSSVLNRNSSSSIPTTTTTPLPPSLSSTTSRIHSAATNSPNNDSISLSSLSASSTVLGSTSSTFSERIQHQQQQQQSNSSIMSLNNHGSNPLLDFDRIGIGLLGSPTSRNSGGGGPGGRPGGIDVNIGNASISTNDDSINDEILSLRARTNNNNASNTMPLHRQHTLHSSATSMPAPVEQQVHSERIQSNLFGASASSLPPLLGSTTGSSTTTTSAGTPSGSGRSSRTTTSRQSINSTSTGRSSSSTANQSRTTAASTRSSVGSTSSTLSALGRQLEQIRLRDEGGGGRTATGEVGGGGVSSNQATSRRRNRSRSQGNEKDAYDDEDDVLSSVGVSGGIPPMCDYTDSSSGSISFDDSSEEENDDGDTSVSASLDSSSGEDNIEGGGQQQHQQLAGEDRTKSPQRQSSSNDEDHASAAATSSSLEDSIQLSSPLLRNIKQPSSWISSPSPDVTKRPSSSTYGRSPSHASSSSSSMGLTGAEKLRSSSSLSASSFDMMNAANSSISSLAGMNNSSLLRAQLGSPSTPQTPLATYIDSLLQQSRSSLERAGGENSNSTNSPGNVGSGDRGGGIGYNSRDGSVAPNDSNSSISLGSFQQNAQSSFSSASTNTSFGSRSNKSKKSKGLRQHSNPLILSPLESPTTPRLEWFSEQIRQQQQEHHQQHQRLGGIVAPPNLMQESVSSSNLNYQNSLSSLPEVEEDVEECLQDEDQQGALTSLKEDPPPNVPTRRESIASVISYDTNASSSLQSAPQQHQQQSSHPQQRLREDYDVCTADQDVATSVSPISLRSSLGSLNLQEDGQKQVVDENPKDLSPLLPTRQISIGPNSVVDEEEEDDDGILTSSPKKVSTPSRSGSQQTQYRRPLASYLEQQRASKSPSRASRRPSPQTIFQQPKRLPLLDIEDDESVDEKLSSSTSSIPCTALLTTVHEEDEGGHHIVQSEQEEAHEEGDTTNDPAPNLPVRKTSLPVSASSSSNGKNVIHHGDDRFLNSKIDVDVSATKTSSISLESYLQRHQQQEIYNQGIYSGKNVTNEVVSNKVKSELLTAAGVDDMMGKDPPPLLPMRKISQSSSIGTGNELYSRVEHQLRNLQEHQVLSAAVSEARVLGSDLTTAASKATIIETGDPNEISAKLVADKVGLGNADDNPLSQFMVDLVQKADSGLDSEADDRPRDAPPTPPVRKNVDLANSRLGMLLQQTQNQTVDSGSITLPQYSSNILATVSDDATVKAGNLQNDEQKWPSLPGLPTQTLTRCSSAPSHRNLDDGKFLNKHQRSSSAEYSQSSEELIVRSLRPNLEAYFQSQDAMNPRKVYSSGVNQEQKQYEVLVFEALTKHDPEDPLATFMELLLTARQPDASTTKEGIDGKTVTMPIKVRMIPDNARILPESCASFNPKALERQRRRRMGLLHLQDQPPQSPQRFEGKGNPRRRSQDGTKNHKLTPRQRALGRTHRWIADAGDFFPKRPANRRSSSGEGESKDDDQSCSSSSSAGSS